MSCEFCKWNNGQTVKAVDSSGILGMYEGELCYERDLDIIGTGGYIFTSDYFEINYCPMCGMKLREPNYDKDSLEKLALEVREVIYAIYPDYYENYTGEMLHSPEYVFDIAELICKEKEESE